MKIAFRFTARSDKGGRRSKNDDSGYGGRYLAVVADGMGGHVGGDVASATTVLNLTPLDHPDFDGTASIYLADEIQSANAIINELAANDARLAGMGTTCTALLVDGDHIELAHIGDSRAYRLRPADHEHGFEQITTDHTFVQRLLSEGRITPEEAETHPHRNVIMRVLGDVDASPELELKTLDAQLGERWVLASDGLEAVVSDAEIEQVMRSTGDLDVIADTLIDMTLERGAPDNVTVVALQVIDRSVLPVDEPVGESSVPAAPSALASAAGASAMPWTPAALSPEGDSLPERHLRRFRRARDLTGSLLHGSKLSEQHPVEAARTSAEILRGELGLRPHQLVGSASAATMTGKIPAVTNRTLEQRATLAQRTIGAQESLPEELQVLVSEDEPVITPRRWPVRLFSFVLIAVLLIGGIWGGLKWIETRYYVAESNGYVAIYNGVSQQLGPVRLSHVVDESDIPLSSLSEHNRTQVRNTITASSLEDAQQIVARLRTHANSNISNPTPASHSPGSVTIAPTEPSASISPGTITEIPGIVVPTELTMTADPAASAGGEARG